MTTDRQLLWIAQGFYAFSGAMTLWRLRATSTPLPAQRANYMIMLCGFAFHTGFLSMRGEHVGRCPLTNSFETTMFISWAAVLFYLIVGPAYRLSFLGAFTSPLVLAISLTALLVLDDTRATTPPMTSPWIEFHAAMAMLAYGAFALAFVAGAMYLLQERQLKTRRLGPAFLQFPSIEQLDQINFRLIAFGFAMLTIGMIGGVISYRIVGHWTALKLVWATVVWLIYAMLLLARKKWSLQGRRVAVASMASFAFVLVTFWGVIFVSR